MRNTFFIPTPLRYLIVFVVCVVGLYFSHTKGVDAQVGNLWSIPLSFPSPRTSLHTVADVRLVNTPLYPRPQSSVTIGLDTTGSFITLDNATMHWFVNDVEQKDSLNERQITIETGAPGSDVKIKAMITTKGGNSYQAIERITPGDVDIIAEPHTLVPVFYKGRAQPSTNATVRLVAVPLLYVAGKPLPSPQVSFTWSINGKVQGGGPQLGKNSLLVTMPLAGDVLVSVTATSYDGTRIAQHAERIRNSEPRVVIYEDTTLYGLLHISQNSYLVPKEEITLRAEPYYLPDNSTVHYAWAINGKSVASASSNSRLITLEKNTSRIPSSVAVTLENLSVLAKTIRKTFTVQFADTEFITL